MLNFLLSLQMCDNENMLRAFKMVHVFINIAKVLIPILIIIKLSIDLGKAVIASKDDEIKSITHKAPKMIIAGLIVFFIPTVINYLFDTLVKYQETATDFAGCSTCLTNDAQCDDLIAIAHQDWLDEKQKVGEYFYIDVDIDSAQKEAEKRRRERPQQRQTEVGIKNDTVAKGKYFDSENVTKISGLTEAQLTEIIKSSTAYGGKAKVFLPLVKDLIAAEKNHGVNAFYLMGVYALESGWLGSALAKDCNNLGGVRYYNQKTVNGHPITNCGGHSGWAQYQNRSDFVEYQSSLLERNYLTPGASHYYGTSVADIAKDYGHGGGVDSIINIAANISGTKTTSKK